MCNCIKESQEKLFDNLVKRGSEKGITVMPLNYDEGIENVAFTLTQELGVDTLRIYTNFIYRSFFKKRDGTDSKPKKYITKLFFTFCPFCGKKYVTVDDVKKKQKAKK